MKIISQKQLSVFILFILMIFSGTSLMLSYGQNQNQAEKKVLQLKPDGKNGMDASVCDAGYGDPPYPERNYEDNPVLHMVVWTSAKNNVPVFRWQAYIQFNELNNIPKKAVIDSAFISVYTYTEGKHFNGGQFGENDFSVFPVTEKWKEKKITWLNKPAYNKEVFAESDISENEQSVRINVTKLVEYIRQHKNYGFLLKHSDEEPYKSCLIYSSDNEVAKYHPELVVYYH